MNLHAMKNTSFKYPQNQRRKKINTILFQVNPLGLFYVPVCISFRQGEGTSVKAPKISSLFHRCVSFKTFQYNSKQFSPGTS